MGGGGGGTLFAFTIPAMTIEAMLPEKEAAHSSVIDMSIGRIEAKYAAILSGDTEASSNCGLALITSATWPTAAGR